MSLVKLRLVFLSFLFNWMRLGTSYSLLDFLDFFLGVSIVHLSCTKVLPFFHFLKECNFVTYLSVLPKEKKRKEKACN